MIRTVLPLKNSSVAARPVRVIRTLKTGNTKIARTFSTRVPFIQDDEPLERKPVTACDRFSRQTLAETCFSVNRISELAHSGTPVTPLETGPTYFATYN